MAVKKIKFWIILKYIFKRKELLNFNKNYKKVLKILNLD
jgi:hypothetical protein